MKRWLIVGLAVAALAVIIVANLNRSSGTEVEARVDTVTRVDLTATISAPGRIRAVSSVDISAEVPGRVVELNVQEGDSVRAGDVLLRLDDTAYRSRVAQSRAALASARAGQNLAQARLDKLTKEKTRVQAMFEKGLASQERLDNILADYEIQVADTESRRQDAERSQAALDEARDNLEKTVYRAPVSSVVSRLNIEIGENVIVGTMNNPGTVILTLADLSRMEVEAEVDETDVIDVAVGQSAVITVDAIADTTFEGSVVSVGHSGRRAGAGTGDEVINFEVKVRFARSEPRLRPGMTADVEVETRHRSGVLSVPIQALVARSRASLLKEARAAARERGDSPPESPAKDLDDDARRKWEREIVEGVYAVREDIATFVPVTSGVADDTRIEVSGELEEGETLVSGPYRILRDLQEGTRIKVVSRDTGDSE